jgi:hypothetical protein
MKLKKLRKAVECVSTYIQQTTDGDMPEDVQDALVELFSLVQEQYQQKAELLDQEIDLARKEEEGEDLLWGGGPGMPYGT